MLELINQYTYMLADELDDDFKIGIYGEKEKRKSLKLFTEATEANVDFLIQWSPNVVKLLFFGYKSSFFLFACSFNFFSCQHQIWLSI
jgi:hypothetical protein